MRHHWLCILKADLTSVNDSRPSFRKVYSYGTQQHHSQVISLSLSALFCFSLLVFETRDANDPLQTINLAQPPQVNPQDPPRELSAADQERETRDVSYFIRKVVERNSMVHHAPHRIIIVSISNLFRFGLIFFLRIENRNWIFKFFLNQIKVILVLLITNQIFRSQNESNKWDRFCKNLRDDKYISLNINN